MKHLANCSRSATPPPSRRRKPAALAANQMPLVTSARLAQRSVAIRALVTADKLNEQLGKTALMTGAQFALRHIDESQKQPKAKCPFMPQREMIAKLWGADGQRDVASHLSSRIAKPMQPTLFD